MGKEDDVEMAKLGYKQELFRGLGAVMNFAFGFTEVAVVLSVAICFGGGLTNGGPASIIWTFIVTFALTTCIAFSMAEICSAYPSAGCVYHWAAQLAPESSAPLWSYVTGWANFVGNAAGDAAFANGFASFLSAAVVASGGDDIDPNAQVGIAILILLSWTLLNFIRIDSVGSINTVAAVTQICTLFILIFGVPSCASTTNPVAVIFGDYWSTGGWEMLGFPRSYVGAVGMTTSLFIFAGYEASGHMAEETEDAAVAAPKGIITTVLATGVGATCLLLSLVAATSYENQAANSGPYGKFFGSYAASFGYDDPGHTANVPSQWMQVPGTYFDTTTGWERTSTGNAVANLLMQAAGGKCGHGFGRFMIWLIVINAFFAGLSSVTVTGRITYALARDNGFPLSDRIKVINERFQSPMRALTFVFFSDVVLLLLLFIPNGGGPAFAAIVGLSTIGFQISYGLPILAKLIYQPANFPESKFDLGKYSRPLGIISCIWLFGTNFFYFLPAAGPIDASITQYTNPDGLPFTILSNPKRVDFGDGSQAQADQNPGGYTADFFLNDSALSCFNGTCTGNYNETAVCGTFATICFPPYPNASPMFYPSTSQLFIANMNWEVVVVAGVFVFATINWFANSRRTFRGPARVGSQDSTKGPESAELASVR